MGWFMGSGWPPCNTHGTKFGEFSHA
jgi:hypothetical protein